MTITNLSELFLHTLEDLYYAENQIRKAMPKMIKKTGDSKLRGQFEDHLDETEKQIERLKQVFKSIGKEVAGEKCPAIVGIIEEVQELMEQIDDADTLDAALIGAAQVVEHYEITRYGTLCVWARQLGYMNAKKLLEETLSEEKDADDKLSQIAEKRINERAAA